MRSLPTRKIAHSRYEGDGARLVGRVGLAEGSSLAPRTIVGNTTWPLAIVRDGGMQLISGLSSRSEPFRSAWGDAVDDAAVLPVSRRDQGGAAAALFVEEALRWLPDDDSHHSVRPSLGTQTLRLAALKFPQPERLQRSAEHAMQGARRAARLTQHLLAFARRQPLDPKPIDPNKLVSSMSNLPVRTLGERIEVQTVLAAGLWRVEVDPNQLESALLNLAVNARDAMTEGGKLTIETSNTYLDERYAQQHAEVTPGQYVVICVSDTGVGMSPEVAVRVFEPFFTTKPTGQGTGLGLSQVYGFVKQSGGHVKVYSEPNEGTTVKLYLPRLLGQAGEEERGVQTSAPAGDFSETVLVVEDQDGVRDYACDILSELGYRVLQASDGPAALRMLDRESVDLLFTDVGLPSMNGRELATEALQRRPNLKVLFTTGYARNAVVHHGRLDPGVHMIGKPFTYCDLAAKVRYVLDRS